MDSTAANAGCAYPDNRTDYSDDFEARIALAGTDEEGTMADITYRTGTSGMVAHGTTNFARIAAWCTQFAEGAREGQQIAARYHALSQLSRPDLATRGLTRETIARAALTGG